MFTLATFGGLLLRSSDRSIPSRVCQRRRLALLAVLAAEGRPVSRDKLLGLLWPETDADRGRHLLADSLYVLRTGLSEDAIETLGADVSLNEEVVASDVGSFLRAIDQGALETAVSAYSGAFLDGIFISDAPEFERWTESTRNRLEAERRRCLERLATDADERGESAPAVEWWQALAAADRFSSRAALGLLRALVVAGDGVAALHFARVHEEIVRSELESEPDPKVSAFVAELRQRRIDPAGPALRRLPAEAAPEQSIVSPPQAGDATDIAPGLTRKRKHRRLAVVIGVTLLAAVVGITVVRQFASVDTLTDGRIAVVPFDVISSDSDAVYVADGISEQLASRLMQLQLPVMSTMAGAAAKRSHPDPVAIAKYLGVRYYVVGTVRFGDGHLRARAELIDATHNVVIAFASLDTTYSLTSTMEFEKSAAESIAVALHVPLARTLASDRGRWTSNKAAHDAYLMGATILRPHNADVFKAIEYFEKATQLDTGYALAYVGLADAYASLAVGNNIDSRADTYFPLARDAATHALRINNTLAEAHATLGYFELLYRLDWKAADAELKRAVDLQPSYQPARFYRTILFEWRGQFRNAVNEARTARELDPTSTLMNIELGRAFYFDHKDDSAGTYLRKALDVDSRSVRANIHLGQVLLRQGAVEDGLAALTTAANLSPRSSRSLALLANAYAVTGSKRKARLILDSLERRSRSAYVPAFDFAIVNAGLSDTTATFQWLDSSVVDHSIRPFLLDPTFEGVRRDRRYSELIARLARGPR